MNFASDNTSGASPAVMEALVKANAGVLPSYGADPHSERAKEKLAALFACDPAIALVATGTAANAVALGTLVPPGGAVFCHAAAHIHNEECAAPEFYTNGGKLVGVAGRNGKIDPDALRAALRRFPVGPARQAQPACLSLSQATESGTVYTLDEIRLLSGIAHEAGLTVHMDGARFANALLSLGTEPAGMSHQVGIDALSFGASKNGTLACEAILVFDKAVGKHLPFIQKRGGHVLSKGRLLGAQLEAYLADGHWLDLARHANAMAARLAQGLTPLPGFRLPWPCDANEVFAIFPAETCRRLRSAGASFYDWDADYLSIPEQPAAGEAFVRMICSFATSAAEVDKLISLAQNGGDVASRPQ